eukprot:11156285-Karenia_brevis.AAC.1
MMLSMNHELMRINTVDVIMTIMIAENYIYCTSVMMSHDDLWSHGDDDDDDGDGGVMMIHHLSLIHISEPTRH